MFVWVFFPIRSLSVPAEANTIVCFTLNVDISIVEAVALRSENSEGWGERFMDKEKLVLSLETSSQRVDVVIFCVHLDCLNCIGAHKSFITCCRTISWRKSSSVFGLP